MPADFSGKWEEVKKVNLEPFLDLMAVPEASRKFVKEQKKNCTIEQDGNNIKLTVDTPKGEKKMNLKVDGTEQEFEDFLRGGTLKASLNWEGDNLVSDMTINNKPVKVVRHLEGNQMIMDMICEGETGSLIWARR